MKDGEVLLHLTRPVALTAFLALAVATQAQDAISDEATSTGEKYQ